MEMFFEILFLGLLAAAVVGIAVVSVVTIKRLFNGQS